MLPYFGRPWYWSGIRTFDWLSQIWNDSLRLQTNTSKRMDPVSFVFASPGSTQSKPINRAQHVQGAWQNFWPNIEAFGCLWCSKVLQVPMRSQFIEGSQLPALALRRKPYIRCRSGRPKQQLFHLHILRHMKCEASPWLFHYHLYSFI